MYAKMYTLSGVFLASADRLMIKPDITFRPIKIITQVQNENEGIINRLVFGNTDQLVCSVDAYNWSMRLYSLIRDQFYKEHGLLDKTDEEIQDYLDDNELEVPDPCKIYLPTIRVNETITIYGRFKTDTPIAFIGLGFS